MSSHNPTQHIHHSKGFTLVEMLIVAPIVILMIGIFVSAIVSMTGDVLATRASNSMAYNIQDALNRIQSDVILSGSFLATNNISVVSPQGYNNNDTTPFHNANVSGTVGQILVLNTYTTTANPSTSTRNLVYMSNQPNACNSPLVSQNQPLMMNVVYFVKSNTLWRRVIAPANYTTSGCVSGSVGLPWQQPSCAVGTTGTICATKDERLVDGVQTFTINYYSTPSSTTANTIAVDSSQSDSIRLAALQTTSTISATISATSTVAGRDISQTGTIRATSPNSNSASTSDTVTNSIVANLDAGNTASYSGSGTAWNDLSGNGNNSTLQYGVGFNNSNGGTLVFDGVDDRVIKGSSINTGNNFSVFAWVNPQTATSGRNVIVSNAYPYSADQGWFFSFQSNNSFFLSIGSDNAWAQSASGIITNGNWNYIGATTNNGGASFNLYYNGNNTPIASGAISGRNVSYANTTFYIGNRGAEYYKGQMSNVTIYNRALSSSEVLQNFNALRSRYGI